MFSWYKINDDVDIPDAINNKYVTYMTVINIIVRFSHKENRK